MGTSFYSWKPAGEFFFVDCFVKETAKFIMDLKNVTHHDIRQFPKLSLGEPTNWPAKQNGHATEKLVGSEELVLFFKIFCLLCQKFRANDHFT